MWRYPAALWFGMKSHSRSQQFDLAFTLQLHPAQPGVTSLTAPAEEAPLKVLRVSCKRLALAALEVSLVHFAQLMMRRLRLLTSLILCLMIARSQDMLDTQDGRYENYQLAVRGLAQSGSNGRRLREPVSLLSDLAEGSDRLAGDAAAHLAYIYTFKLPHPRRAFTYANQSAHLRSPKGMHLVAFFLRHGQNGFARNVSLADEFELESAENNYLQAQMALGFKYFVAMKNATDDQLAIDMCRRSFDYYQAASINAENMIRRNYWDDFLALYGLDDRDRLGDKIQAQVDRDRETLEYYAYEAKHGDGKAAFELWRAHFFGLYGLRRDESKAMRFLEEAVSAESIPATAELGRLLTVGHGVEVDLSRGLSLLRFAGEYNDSSALTTLGILIRRGLFSTNDPSLGLKYLQKAANLGNPEAEYELAQLEMLEGKTESASLRFQRSAQVGHVKSMIALSNMYEKGIGVSRSCERAVLFLKRAVEAGPWNEEMRDSKRLYVERSSRSSFYLSLLAADEGYEIGQFNAAWLVMRRKYIPPMKAPGLELDLLSKAYLQSHEKSAPLLLGDVYSRRPYKNTTKAALFYSVAAERGSAVAMSRLASLMSIGAGLAQDEQAAILLLQKALFLVQEELHGQRHLLKCAEMILRLTQIRHSIFEQIYK